MTTTLEITKTKIIFGVLYITVTDKMRMSTDIGIGKNGTVIQNLWNLDITTIQELHTLAIQQR